MPDQVGDAAVGRRPVVSDAGDPAQGVAALVTGGVHLADDRVFGAGDLGRISQRRQRRAHAVAAVHAAHRLQRPRRVG
ncbi:hypothetical protein MELE44368_14245 [Mycolicibacterium elephantis DSM 44368]|uniref:Uncharacterized protein n=1 Tax=Mycolicibacterium elephantis DSM 44368 TaxID=1335622 RepID=A0A439DXR7_9MYCO|nr:hypothetical protein MELE44368_14245 [Mycolicibacterium elephantis DSM 44368]